MYIPEPYPSWRYSPNHPPRLVHSQEEDAALAREWDTDDADVDLADRCEDPMSDLIPAPKPKPRRKK